MTDRTMIPTPARTTTDAKAAHPPRKARVSSPLQPSLAERAAGLAGALLATALLLGSQIGLAVDYTADAQARQLATARTRVVAQQAAPSAPVGGAEVSKLDAPVTAF